MLKHKIKTITRSPHAQRVLHTLKPEKSFWGFIGVIVFFILPEIVAFIWGVEITIYAKESLPVATALAEKQYYELLIMLFEEGGSWVNLSLGIGLLVWLFF